MANIGQKIRKLRLKSQRPQREIAAILGISIPAYSKIESGMSDVNTARLIEISHLFNVNPGDFFLDIAPSQMGEQMEMQIRSSAEKIEEMKDRLITCMEKNSDLLKKIAGID